MQLIKPETKTIAMERIVALINKVNFERGQVTGPSPAASAFTEDDLELILDAVLLHYLFS